MVDLGDFKGRIDLWNHNGDSMTAEEALCNAKLIVASKDLLTASIKLLGEYRDKGNLLGYDVDIARQAVKKALGKNF